MNYILIAVIVISLLICLETLIKRKKNLIILIFFGLLFFLSNIIIFGISFSPKSSFIISNLFMGNYIEEYKIDDNNTIVIGKNKDSYFMYNSRDLFGFIYVKKFSKINEMYLYPKTYGIDDNDTYFYNLEFIQVNEHYLFLVKENGNVNDQIFFDEEQVYVINHNNIDKYILFISSHLPEEVRYNNIEMNIIYKNQLIK